MKRYILSIFLAVLAAPVFAQLPVTAAPDHATLLKSSDPQLARNKKLVYDFWRILLEARHVELADQYLTESYIQHNPNVPTGRAAFVEHFSQFPKQDIKPTVQRPLVAIIAEGDRVVLAFVDTRPIDPADKSKTYTTTWFDMFRIENGKIAEHWDVAQLAPPAAK